MKNTKHTPGPWGWEKRRDGSMNLIGDGKIIAANVDLVDLIGFGDVREQNARLIKMAPDMFMALHQIIEWISQVPSNAREEEHYTIELMCKHLISKIEGGDE